MKFRPLSELESELNPEVLTKARMLYEHESFNMKLKALREKYGVKQRDVNNFTQTAVSKLEHRKDIKISTLINYLKSMDMGLEITALPKCRNAKKEVLLKVL
jgi:transcriptional regulator with XRE-family HTH domain